MPDALYVFATITPKPEHVEDVGKALEALIEPTLKETGCHLFSVFKNRETEGVFHLFEMFENETAIQSHYAEEYTKAVFSKYEQWLTKPVGVIKLSANSPLSAEQFLCITQTP